MTSTSTPRLEVSVAARATETRAVAYRGGGVVHYSVRARGAHALLTGHVKYLDDRTPAL